MSDLFITRTLWALSENIFTCLHMMSVSLAMPDVAVSSATSSASLPAGNADGASRNRRSAARSQSHVAHETDSPGAKNKAAKSEKGGRGERGGRANVYQVAELAGVSPGTVSCVLNNRGRVGAETRVRVLAAARSLGFRPQVQIRTKQVGVVADSIWHSCTMAVIINRCGPTSRSRFASMTWRWWFRKTRWSICNGVIWTE